MEQVDEPFVFPSLMDYYKQAKSVMRYFRICYNPDSEYIGHVAESMMIADWKYVPDKGCSRNSYRLLRAKYAILDYYNDHIKNKRKDISITDSIVDNSRIPITLDEIIELIDSTNIDKKQRKFIIDSYINGKKMREIAAENGISKQCVHQYISKGMKYLNKHLTKVIDLD